MKHFNISRSKVAGMTGRVIFSLSLVFYLISGGCNDEPTGPAGGPASPPVATPRDTQDQPITPVSEPNTDDSIWNRPRSQERIAERKKMAQAIRQYYGFTDDRVTQAMENVPRHWFVRSDEQRLAYADTPLPIGEGQTISQPFIVAHMTQLLKLDENKNVLEIGTGSGYQAAVLNEFTPQVYTIEIVKPLALTAIERFRQHGYHNIRVKIGDGYKGWPEHAPFDAIIVTAAAEKVPPPLIEQLKPGGRMYIPIGSPLGLQELVLVTKNLKGKVTTRPMMPVRFVPFTRDKEQ